MLPTRRLRLTALAESIGMITLTGFIAVGCVPSVTPPDAIKVFNPDPGRNFQASTGLVSVANLGSANAVCFTTDGSDPVYNFGTCKGGSTLGFSGTSLLLSCSSSDTSSYTEKTIKLVFDWPDTTTADGYSENRVEGKFILDCSPPGTPQDADKDGILDAVDNCPVVANPDQADSDGDGIGDACEAVTPPNTDADHDGIDDAVDNCPNVANPDQIDKDHDGIGAACDTFDEPDADKDGIADASDNCPNTANPDQADADGDHIGDICDPAPHGDDPDGDGIPAQYDNCPDVANTTQLDSDHDGIGNACDPDAAFVLLKVKTGGRCLRVESGNDVKSTSSCSATTSTQQWEMIDVSKTVKMFKNRSNNQCLTQQDILGWKDQLTANCNSNDNKQKWTIEPYTQGGADAAYPVRLHNVASDFCVYTDGTGNVFGTLLNCGLLGTDANRKIGIYFGGNFSSTPFTP